MAVKRLSYEEQVEAAKKMDDEQVEYLRELYPAIEAEAKRREALAKEESRKAVD